MGRKLIKDMQKDTSTVKSAENLPSGIISSLGAWGPKVVTGRLADAIVSRIGSHYVVSIMVKPITMELRVSALSIHLKAFMDAAFSIINEEGGESPNVEEENKQ